MILRHNRLSRWLAVVQVLALVASGAEAGAQVAGASFLQLPIGARSVGSGQATVADTLGVEAMWWNPGALAAMERSELALSGSQTYVGTSATVGYARPSRAIGTVALSANIVDYGEQGVTGETGGPDLAKINIRSTIAMLSYATPIGSRLRVGLNYKYARWAFSCAGLCGVSSYSGSSSAVDAGVQLVLPTTIPVTLAGAVRNIGPDFQVKDSEQADPLPRTWQVGASARIPSERLDAAETTVDIMTDVLSTLGEPVSLRIGSVLTYRARYSLRAGYMTAPDLGGGPSLGLGVFLSDGMVLDIASHFDGYSAVQSATYVTLRFLF